MNSSEEACRYCGEFVVRGGALASHERACATGGSQRRRRSRYREMFFATNGIGPYECFFCNEEVEFSLVVIHHVDHDHTNNSIDNLAASHRKCHNGHHFALLWQERKEDLLSSPTRGHRTPHSEEAKRKMSKAHKEAGHRPSDAAIAKAAEINTGKKKSEEVRKNISEGRRRAAERRRQGGGAQ